MALYTIADLHLPLGIDKPMDIFGKAWENYVERLADNWQSVVKKNDVVVLPGDFSWATYLEQSVKDFEYLHKLNGKKILLKGNHDYWWTTMNKLREFTAEHGFDDIEFLQNNSFMYDDAYACAAVMVRILEDYSLLNLDEVEECFEMEIGHLTPDTHLKCKKNKKKQKKNSKKAVNE